MISYKELCAEAELLIRAGRIADAAAKLKSVQLAKIANHERLTVANLFRRTNQALTALRILTPVVRAGRELSRQASVEECSEYAVLLMRVGATQEAVTLLQRLPQDKHPQISFHLALALITQWDYAAAIPYLNHHLKNTADPYQRKVTEMNLAAASYYTGDLQAATNYAAGVHGAKDASRLRANALEILARVAIDENRLPEAGSLLDEASEIFARAQTFDQLFIQGVRAYLQALNTGDSGALLAYRQEATARKRYESVREADLLLLRLNPAQTLFDRLYFGTPYTALRTRICDFSGLKPKSDSYIMGEGETVLDAVTLRGGKPQGLIQLILRDLYRPLSVGAAFNELFPDEYFDVNTSPHRIRQLAHRGRTWLAEEKLGLHILSERRLYRFETHNLRIRLSETYPSLSITDRVLGDLTSAFPEASFSLKVAQEKLKIEESTLRRALKAGLEQGRLGRFGAGSRTVYFSK